MALMTDFDKGIQVLMTAEIYPGLLTRSSAQVELRLWIYPSFEPYRSWTILRDGDDLYLRRILWDPRKRHITDDPITYARERKVQAEDFDPLRRELAAITFPAFQRVDTIGIDGVTYGLEVGGFQSSARIQWWGDPPNGWEALAGWHERVVRVLDERVPRSALDKR